MYKKLLLLLLIVSSSFVNAQTVFFDFSEKELIPCEIALSDGNILKGYIKDFTVPNTVEFGSFGYDFMSIEKDLNLDRKTFNFKKELTDKTQKLDLENIHAITLIDSDTIRYEKLKLKTINSSNKVVDLNKTVMIPLIKEGKINLYGLRAYMCPQGGKCEMMFVIAYIKNQKQDYAYIPMDFNRINLFNLGKIDDKFLKSFEEAGSDCPDYLAYLQEKRKDFNDRSFQKSYKEKRKKFNKEKKAKLKLIKGRENKQREEDRLDTEFFLTLYTEFIDAYASRCDN